MISKKYKCIFIHIHKTAGGAIWRSFKDDFIEIGAWNDKADDYAPGKDPNNLPSGGIHHTAEMVRDFIGDPIWNDYFKFTIVRSPWGKKVGSYEHTRRDGSYGTPKDWGHGNYLNWLKTFKMARGLAGDYHDLNQFDWLTIDGKMSMDYVIRFEHFKEDWRKVVDILQLPEPNELTWGGHPVDGFYQFPEAYGFQQSSVPLDYSKYYSEESREYVAERWKKDIEYFGFEFMNNNYNENRVGLLNKKYE